MDVKDMREIITCSICFEFFDEYGRYPRMLSCGHTFCHCCMGKILKKSPSCPTCKTVIQHREAKLIPVNFSVKSMIPLAKQINALEANDLFLQTAGSCSIPDRFKSEGFCSEHSYFNELRCMDCMSWICAMCCSLNHKQCRTLLVKDAYSEMKEKVFQNIDKELEARVEISKCIPVTLDNLDEERKILQEEIKKTETVLKVCEKRISDLHSLLTKESEYCTNLKRLRIKVETSTNSSEYSIAVNELTDLNVHGKNLLCQMRSLRAQNLEKFFSNSAPVYVVEDSNEVLYGQIEMKDCHIWIHSFQTEKPDGFPLPLQELLAVCGIASALPRKLFLKLSPEGESDCDAETVDVVIETDGESPRPKNFSLICSGLVEQTYKGKTIEHYDNPSRFLLDSGPLPVVEGIRNSDPKTPWEEGFVYGMSEENSYFNIAMENNSNYSKHKIGVVVSGLQTLKDFSGRNLIIKESGLVI